MIYLQTTCFTNQFFFLEGSLTNRHKKQQWVQNVGGQKKKGISKISTSGTGVWKGYGGMRKGEAERRRHDSLDERHKIRGGGGRGGGRGGGGSDASSTRIKTSPRVI